MEKMQHHKSHIQDLSAKMLDYSDHCLKLLSIVDRLRVKPEYFVSDRTLSYKKQKQSKNDSINVGGDEIICQSK